jgi:hypothetical protein
MAAAVAASLTLASSASAQAVFLGAGATIPTSTYGDYAKTGWMGFGGVLFPVGDAGLSVGGEGFYGSNSHETEGDKTNLYGAMGLVGFSFMPEASAQPFVYAGAGYMTHSYKSDSFPTAEGSESAMAVGLGGGVSFPLGGVRGMAAASYNQGLDTLKETKFIGISAAIQIMLGGAGG